MNKLQNSLVEQLKELSILSSDQFKSRAYAKAAKQVELLDTKDFMSRTDFLDIEGIGKSINSKILYFKENHQIPQLEKLREIQKDYLDPKLYKIRKTFITKRIPYKTAKYYLDNILNLLGSSELSKVIPVGSFRRKAEYIADLDLLVNDAEVYCSFINEIKIHSNFTLLVQGPKKVSFLIDNAEKTQVDITLNEDPKLIGYATLHFTGSKEFNIRCRNAAIKKGYRLSQNGLKPIDTNTPEAPELLTEKEILSFIGIGYVKPENR